jgi:predicted acetyltransferase
MAVSIRDARRLPEDRDWIERTYWDYLDDLAAGSTGVFPALTVTGQGTVDLLAPWFRDERVTPLVILQDGRAAGFAVVQRTTIARAGPGACHKLTEFFIREQSRRLGLGRAAATLIFDRFEGDWIVTETLRHRGAVAFWRRVIAGYTGGRYRERSSSYEVQHSFRSGPRKSPGEQHQE